MSKGHAALRQSIEIWRREAFRARREGLVRKLATCITVLTAAIAILFVAAAAVVITIT